MNHVTKQRLQSTFPLLAAIAVSAAIGCGGGASPVGAPSALSSDVVTTSTAAGTLLCAPAQVQLDACANKAAGAACTIPAPTAGGTDTAGTCHATLDGASVACVPTPPAPPQALIDACAGKAANDACTSTEPDGDVQTGACALARDGTTLACFRVHEPTQAEIDACATLTAGAACTFPDRHGNGNTHAGVCSVGPSGTGALACKPPQGLLPDATTACAGLANGVACTLHSHRSSVAGTCVTPAAGGDAVCLVPCGALGGSFGHCGGGHGGPGGGGPRGHGGH